MKREYIEGTRSNITYFTGVEVVSTPAAGMNTLFVVGCQPFKDIDKQIRKSKIPITHIYFGANQSFAPDGTAIYWNEWEATIKDALKDSNNYWVTLDFDVTDVLDLLESGLTEHNRFIPQISVKIPYINQLGYNATLKIDDIDFNKSNPGVWCHSVHELMDKSKFTDWTKYTSDVILK